MHGAAAAACGEDVFHTRGSAAWLPPCCVLQPCELWVHVTRARLRVGKCVCATALLTGVLTIARACASSPSHARCMRAFRQHVQCSLVLQAAP